MKDDGKKFGNIQNLFGKFTKLLSHATLQSDKVIEVLEREFGITLEKKQITIRNGKVFIQVNPIIKNEILLHKKELLEQLKPYRVYDIK